MQHGETQQNPGRGASTRAWPLPRASTRGTLEQVHAALRACLLAFEWQNLASGSGPKGCLALAATFFHKLADVATSGKPKVPHRSDPKSCLEPFYIFYFLLLYYYYYYYYYFEKKYELYTLFHVTTTRLPHLQKSLCIFRLVMCVSPDEPQ